MTLICGVDIGGTFTDCVVVSEDEVIHSKVPTTPDDLARGFMASLEGASAIRGGTLAELLGDLDYLVHGTTVATNAMVEGRGAKVGLLTTLGFGDTLQIMRGIGRVKGLSPGQMVRVSATSKPEPLIPRSLVGEIVERIDCFGDVVVALDERQCRESIAVLLESGVEAIAICFLWSFRNPLHEIRARAIVEEFATDCYVTCSHEIAPRWGEYERMATTAINAYVGPGIRRYVSSIAEQVSEQGLARPLLIMQSSGGAVPGVEAQDTAVRTLGSGPAGGLIGARALGALLGHPNVITGDMGGTSFDVGLIAEGLPIARTTSIARQYEYYVPTLDIESIGAGGGSIAWIEPVTGNLRVGPRSAGAVPGPACYGRGGVQATVTDAALVLGYLNPDYFLGGKLKLDRQAATKAIKELSSELGMGVQETASGIVRIAEFHMADIIRKMTVQRGYDPRDFVLFAYGGAGPVHAGVLGAELGVRKVIVPLGDSSSLWSAFGGAAAEMSQVFEVSEVMSTPLEPTRISAAIDVVRQRAEEWLVRAGVGQADREIRYSIDLRYKAQIHELTLAVPQSELVEADVDTLLDGFESKYEKLYGEGSGFRSAGIELSVFRATAVGLTSPPPVQERERSDAVGKIEVGETRLVYWPELGEMRETSILRDSDAARPGLAVEGPAILELPDTTVVVHPQQRVEIDKYGNIGITSDAHGVESNHFKETKNASNN